MAKSRPTTSEILAALKRSRDGSTNATLRSVEHLNAVSSSAWHTSVGKADPTTKVRLEELEAENLRLKQMYAEEKLKADRRKKNMWRD